MAFTKNKIMKSLNQFLKNVEQKGIRIAQAYLFGSYAKGNAGQYSDIDIAIVSSQLKGNLVIDNERLIEMGLLSNFLIEVHPFRPQDFKKSNPFVKEIVETGIKIV